MQLRCIPPPLWLPEIVLPVCWCPLEMISKRCAQSSHEALFCALIFHMSSLFMQGRLASHKHVKTTLEMLLTASRCRTSEIIPVDCGTRMLRSSIVITNWKLLLKMILPQQYSSQQWRLCSHPGKGLLTCWHTVALFTK